MNKNINKVVNEFETDVKENLTDDLKLLTLKIKYKQKGT